VVFNGLDVVSSTTTRGFASDGVQLPMTLKENEKRVKLLNQYIRLKAYVNRIREHPMLANYFKYRVPDNELEF